jgi:hypothetical protein
LSGVLRPLIVLRLLFIADLVFAVRCDVMRRSAELLREGAAVSPPVCVWVRRQTVRILGTYETGRGVCRNGTALEPKPIKTSESGPRRNPDVMNFCVFIKPA